MVNPNNNISRYPHEDAKETARTKPLAPPGNNTFRKSMDERSSGKNQEEEALAENQGGKNPSLFDLSSSKKNSSTSSIKSPDSPTISEPKTLFASSDEPLFDNQAPAPIKPSAVSSNQSNSMDSVVNSNQSKIRPQASVVEQQDTTRRQDYKMSAYVVEGSEQPKQSTAGRDSKPIATTANSDSSRMVENVSSDTSSENQSSNNPSSSRQERLYSEARDSRENNRVRPEQNQQENSDSRNIANEDQKLSNQHSKKHLKTTDSSQTHHQILTNEQQQLRIKKQQIKKQQENNPHIAQTQASSDVKSEKMKGLKESSLEAPLLGDSSEEISLENNLKSSSGAPLKKPMKGEEILSIQKDVGHEELNSQLDGTLLSPDEELGTQLAQLDTPEKQVVSGTIQKNVKSDTIAKEEIIKNSEKLVAGLEERVAELKGDQGKDNKTKPLHLETRHVDIESVPTIQTASLQTGIAADAEQPLPHQTTEELATQIISQIQVLKTKDEMRTTVTLKHPPLLEGATITLTASNNAKKEFNISIANLSPEGKTRLDLHLKENSLIDNLSEKGVTVHMLTTSTQPESFVVLDDKAYREQQEQPREQQSHPNERRQEDDRQQGRQQQRQRNQENEEEENE